MSDATTKSWPWRARRAGTNSDPIWPLAPGAWLLGGVLLLLLVAAVFLVRARRRRERAWPEAAAEELACIEARFEVQHDVVALATALSSLLRRSMLARFPEEKVAALYGDAWFELLCRDESAAEAAGSVSVRQSTRVVRELSETAYAGAGRGDAVRPDEWIAFVRSWIGAAA